MSIASVMPSSHLILCRPLLLPPIPPSIRVFSNESTLRMRWPKDWSFSFNISPSNKHPGLISFRMDWLDLLAAAAAKSLQLCLTLCDPIDHSPPGTPVPGILQAGRCNRSEIRLVSSSPGISYRDSLEWGLHVFVCTWTRR